jgi:hypothetical protein
MIDIEKIIKDGYIRVLGKRVKIEVRDEEQSKARVHTWKKHIIFSDETTTDEKEENLIHEVLHLISDDTSQQLTETQVAVIGSCLYTVFKENNWIEEKPTEEKKK